MDPNHETLGEIPFEDIADLLRQNWINRPTDGLRVPVPFGRTVKIPYQGKEITVKYTKELKFIMRNGARCVKCGCKGARFKLLRNNNLVFGAKTTIRLALWTDDDRQLSIDHIKPRGHGGESSVNSNNIQVMCEPCNEEKGSKYVGV